MASTGKARNSDRIITPSLYNDAQRRYTFVDFLQPITAACTCDTPYGAPTGTAGDVNNVTIGGVTLQQHVIGTQTILAPSRTAVGLNITQDLTSGDGVEYTLGCESPANTVISAIGNGTFTVGTDRPFMHTIKFKLTDVSGTAACVVGWRKSEAYQADFNDYNDLAGLNAKSGTINTETILANAATVETSTTNAWADTETHTLSVIVDSDGSLGTLTSGGIGFNSSVGKVYYEIDGAAPTVVPTTAFKFANASVLIPFFYFKNDTDVAESTILIEWETGFVNACKYGQNLAKQVY